MLLLTPGDPPRCLERHDFVCVSVKRKTNAYEYSIFQKFYAAINDNMLSQVLMNVNMFKKNMTDCINKIM
jgi:hypothetical protein